MANALYYGGQEFDYYGIRSKVLRSRIANAISAGGAWVEFKAETVGGQGTVYLYIQPGVPIYMAPRSNPDISHGLNDETAPIKE
jgi:hypothetical protein